MPDSFFCSIQQIRKLFFFGKIVSFAVTVVIAVYGGKFTDNNNNKSSIDLLDLVNLLTVNRVRNIKVGRAAWSNPVNTRARPIF